MSMLRRIASVAVVGVGSLIMLQAAASAGGWWSFVRVEGRYAAVGETLRAEAEGFFESIEAARLARRGARRYYVYLIKDLDERLLTRAMRKAEPGDWWRAPKHALRVGTVRFSGRDSNLVPADATFTIPDVSTGTYSLMFCDSACRTPLANTVPTDIVITADRLEAETARRLDALTQRVGLRMPRLRRDLRQTRGTVQRLREVSAAAATANEALERRLQAVNERLRSLEQQRSGPTWLVYAGWIVAGMIAFMFAISHRRRRLAERRDTKVYGARNVEASRGSRGPDASEEKPERELVGQMEPR